MPTSPAAPPSSDWQDPATVETMDDLETWAVVGLSGNRGRTAYDIAVLLQERGGRLRRPGGVAMVMDTCPAIEWRKRGR